MALLSLLDVYVSFGGPPILDHLNLQIEEGERVCLLGRNGAGKTTLMRIAAGNPLPTRARSPSPTGSASLASPRKSPKASRGTSAIS